MAVKFLVTIINQNWQWTALGKVPCQEQRFWLSGKHVGILATFFECNFYEITVTSANLHAFITKNTIGTPICYILQMVIVHIRNNF